MNDMPNCDRHEQIHPGIESSCLCLPAHNGCGWCAHPEKRGNPCSCGYQYEHTHPKIGSITTNTVKVGMLRQWLNEDRITDPKKMVTNEDIVHFLTV